MRSTSILLLLTVSLLLALSFTMLASALMMESRFLNLVTTQAVAIVFSQRFVDHFCFVLKIRHEQDYADTF